MARSTCLVRWLVVLLVGGCGSSVPPSNDAADADSTPADSVALDSAPSDSAPSDSAIMDSAGDAALRIDGSASDVGARDAVDTDVPSIPADVRPACCAFDSECPMIDGYPQVCRRGQCVVAPAGAGPGACWSDVDCDGGLTCTGGLLCDCPETCASTGIGRCGG